MVAISVALDSRSLHFGSQTRNPHWNQSPTRMVDCCPDPLLQSFYWQTTPLHTSCTSALGNSARVVSAISNFKQKARPPFQNQRRNNGDRYLCDRHSRLPHLAPSSPMAGIVNHRVINIYRALSARSLPQHDAPKSCTCRHRKRIHRNYIRSSSRGPIVAKR